MENILWPDIWNDEQVGFSEKYFWISAREGKLGCNVCAEAKTLLLWKEASHLAPEWINFEVEASSSNRENKLSSLRTKMKLHNDSSSHQLAETISNNKEERTIEKKMLTPSEKAVTKCSLLMQTAYSVAKNKRALVEYEELVNLQKINSLDLGISLFNGYRYQND